MAAMPVNLDPEKSADVELVAGFRFTDVDESYGILVRRGVAEFQRRFPDVADVSLTTTSAVWKDIVLGRRNAVVALAGNDVEVEGSTLDLVGFLRLFR
jgi:alkyl sulfatase BDS1-like metallo-beta-lactamase superfamily hydrolase